MLFDIHRLEWDEEILRETGYSGTDASRSVKSVQLYLRVHKGLP